MAGRPSAQSIILENLEKIKTLRREGYTEEQIAKSIGIGYRTWMEYKKKLPQFQQVLKESKETLISDLEDTAFRKALGKCKIKTTKKYITQEADGSKKVRVEETEQDIAPDTTLLIFTLKNLTADTGKWRDRRDLDTTSLIDEIKRSMDNASGIFQKIEDELKEDTDND